MVDPAITAAAIGAGSQLLGGFLGRRDARAANDQAMQLADRQIALQKEFAQHGVRWRVEDAKAAGIHPLFALGGSANYSPVNVAFQRSPLPDALAGAGQDISRAIQATRTGDERHQAVMQAQAYRRGELENMLLAAQIRKLSAPQVGPAMPGKVSPTKIETTPYGPEAPVVPGARGAGPKVQLPVGEWSVTPGRISQQTAEDWYGEIGGELVGLSWLLNDAGRAYYDWLFDKVVPVRRLDQKKYLRETAPWPYRGRGRR